MSNLKILFLGDIFGKIGRQAVIAGLPKLKKKYEPDLVIANGENLSHGKGLTETTTQEMMAAGIDFFTSGNHVWDKKDAYILLSKKDFPLVRPANYPEDTPGSGDKVVQVGLKSILIINLVGRVFFREDFDDPFRCVDKILEKHKHENLAAIIVDFHAEATSEKRALGFYLDGRISAFIGSHTHVQTADDQILEQGTAYISDVGMTGAKNSVIGLDKRIIIKNFLSQVNDPGEIPESGICQINGVYLEIDTKTQKAVKIERVWIDVEI
ncbi:MAG: TIGR00282 family metallophosphoesterase [Candidatus Parcubacteria bacterium]|nr:TIGR00282 family metallophosphoesterase [Candidatus Parcubacteria bacterium]